MKERLKSKRKAIFLLPGSLLLALASFSITKAQWDGGGKDVAGESGLQATTAISTIVKALMFWLLLLLGSFAVIGFVISGILYLTSAGNEERMETAKRGMIYSIIGVMVGLGGLIVIEAIESWYTGSADF